MAIAVLFIWHFPISLFVLILIFALLSQKSLLKNYKITISKVIREHLTKIDIQLQTLFGENQRLSLCQQMSEFINVQVKLIYLISINFWNPCPFHTSHNIYICFGCMLDFSLRINCF